MSTLRRYWILLLIFIKVGLMRQMAYRTHFLLYVSGKLIRIALLFFFFQAVFLKIDRLGQWTYDQVLLLFATFHLVDFLISFTFHRNLAFKLPGLIRSGQLDYRMLLPVNLLFVASLEDIDLMDAVSFLPSLFFLGYVLHRIDMRFSLMQLGLYLLLLLNAVVFLYAAVLLIATLSFWTTTSFGLARIFDNLMKIGRYPLDIFEGFWRIFFLYCMPLALIAQIPSQALLRLVSPMSVVAALTTSGLFLAVALKLWQMGLRRYGSAST